MYIGQESVLSLRQDHWMLSNFPYRSRSKTVINGKSQVVKTSRRGNQSEVLRWKEQWHISRIRRSFTVFVETYNSEVYQYFLSCYDQSCIHEPISPASYSLFISHHILFISSSFKVVKLRRITKGIKIKTNSKFVYPPVVSYTQFLFCSLVSICHRLLRAQLVFKAAFFFFFLSPCIHPTSLIESPSQPLSLLLTLQPLWMSSIQFLLTIPPVNQTSRSWELREWSPT